MRTITTCSGLGDTLWLFQKLINQPEKFNWIFPASEPRRAFQLEDVMPQLIGSVGHQEKLSYRKIASMQYNGLWKDTPEKFTLSANTHLESGIRIEKFLPDLETTYLLPFVTKEAEKEAAETVIKGKWIGIYTSAYSMSRHWDGWKKEEWMSFIKMLQAENPEYQFVFFGASYDIGISDELHKELPGSVNLVDQSLGIVIEVMRRLEMLIGFPSGLPILNELAGGKRTCMFYAPHIKKIMNAWADPERITNGDYKGCLFCPPEQIFSWIKQQWL